MGIVTVVGSYNVGLFLKGKHIPAIGETVIGETFFESGGGKGSNQALAAARMCADVRFIGRIGNDKYGDDALSIYKKFGVSSDNIIRDETIHSGISVIFIDESGRNSIMVVPGANYNLTRKDLDDREEQLAQSDIVGFQLENEIDMVLYGIRKCRSLGTQVLLDPAPAVALPDDIYSYISYIKPNEVEASILSGIKVTDQKSAEKAGKWFIDKGVSTAIITLGEKGAVVVGQSETSFFPAPDVKAIDSTGAGDIFSGALMACIADGQELKQAVQTAGMAAAMSVCSAGVVEAIPEYKQVLEFIKKQGDEK